MTNEVRSTSLEMNICVSLSSHWCALFSVLYSSKSERLLGRRKSARCPIHTAKISRGRQQSTFMTKVHEWRNLSQISVGLHSNTCYCAFVPGKDSKW